jgi:DNA (cytosine-5)-methyltransferase 1
MNKKVPYRVPTMASIEELKWNGRNVVSTFSGCGGSCLGLRMAGYRTLFASEFIPAAIETYKANHPHVHLDTRDIRLITPQDILSQIPKGEDVHLMEGSPPCAAFSIAGKRSKGWGQVKPYSDTKQRVDDLFDEFIRLVEGVQPLVFVMENVAGLTQGVARGVLKDCLQSMRALGYQVEARLLDAQFLGVPQARKRVIFQGVRNDLKKKPVWPKPYPYTYSIRDAIPEHVRLHEFGPDVVGKIKQETYKGTIIISASDAPTWKTSIKRIEYVKGMTYASFKDKGGSYSLDKPAPTILANCDSMEKHIKTNWTTVRKRLSIRELKLLCSFPDDFITTGHSYRKQWERFGRSVPPLMMKAIGETIRDNLL